MNKIVGGTNEWRSVHVAVSGPIYSTHCDEVIVRDVLPLVRSWQESRSIDQWFFIRYNDEHDHVRLRVLPRRGHAAVLDRAIDQFVSALENRGMATNVEPEASRVGLRGARRASYDPEFTRYGGVVGITLAERQFCLSSELVVDLLNRMTPLTTQQRLGLALTAMLVQWHACFKDPVAVRTAAARYSRGCVAVSLQTTEAARALESLERWRASQAGALRRLVTATWAALNEKGGLPSAFEAWRRSLRRPFSRLDALARAGHIDVPGRENPSGGGVIGDIAASYVHMTNNRLGITVLEEAYLAHAVESLVVA